MQTADYCREIESYLCRKNDGHLIRIVGPSFDLVSAWAAQGVPLKVAFKGIDQYVERYYRKGPRRRPVKIDFCEADVLEAFDEWRRVVGVVGVARAFQTSGDGSSDSGESHVPSPESRHHASLPAHVTRVVRRLTSARARGSLGFEFDALIDRLAGELDTARAKAGGLRGDARQALIDRLAALDVELLQQARAACDDAARVALASEAEAELAGFRSGMAPDAFARAQEAAIDRLVRERFNLPTVAFA